MKSIPATTAGAQTQGEAATPPPRPPVRRKLTRPATPKAPEGSQQARRTAAAILEVLAGMMTPAEAARGVGISIVRYYVLEARALQGLVSACEPKPIGRVRTPEREIQDLRLQVRRLTNERDRHQALARAAQRALGLKPPAPTPKAPGKKSRKRKPVVRALRVVEALAQGFRAEAQAAPASVAAASSAVVGT